MPVNRVSTSMMHQQNLKDIANVQTSLAKLNRQISSGIKASSFTELNGVVERVSSYQAKLSGVETYLSNNNSITNRLNIMDQAVTQVQDIAEDFASLLVLRRNPALTNGLNFAQQAQALLDTASQALNVSVEGRYLFSGSKTDTPPIKSPMPDLSVTGTPDANYYAGNNENLSARVNDSLRIEYGVTAQEQGFQDLIASIKTAIEADKANSDALLARSVDLVNNSIEGLALIRAGIGSQITSMQNVNEQHEQLKVYWKQAVSEDTSTDIAEASIQLAVDQTVLQATFQSFASLSRLRLTDFLN